MLTATADRIGPLETGSLETGPADTVPRPKRSTSASSYVAFRIAFGVVVFLGQLRFLLRGWVEELYLAPQSHLTYAGFEWVRPLPAPLMYGAVVGLGALGGAIAMGWRTRASAAVFAIGFAYCELIDAALYLNHYWFITLAALVLAVVPAPVAGSIPIVSIWALRAQLAVVYLFAGIAKLNPDWLFRAEPLRTWLAARTDRPLVGPWLDEPFVAYAFSWSGALFDLTIVGWLLWSRSRPIAYVVLVAFHVATAMLFQIGMFPWVMIALTPIFFAPTWPEQWRAFARRRSSTTEPSRSTDRPIGRPVVTALVVLAVLNVVVPLRHVVADGNVRWNDDGYLLAWRVMLTERSTHVVFQVTDPSASSTFEVAAESVLEEWQAATAMTRADLVLATAHLIADDLRAVIGDDIEVRAEAFVAWNGRLRTRWIDADVDLASLDRAAAGHRYVLPEPSRWRDS